MKHPVLFITHFILGGVCYSEVHNKMGEVGRPIIGGRIRLESWEEGGYRVDDKCGSRGEILINTGQLSQGYFSCEGITINWGRGAK